MGYQRLLVYRTATTISDLSAIFCQKFIDKRSRTYDQIIQAARSGKQNIVEGSLENSVEGNLKLTGISRASYGELAEDMVDFLRQHGLPVWNKDDPRVLKIRAFRETTEKPTTISSLGEWTGLNLENPEHLANLIICLCYKQMYLLDQLLKAQRQMFIREGGFKEKLFKERREFLKRNP